MSLMSDKLHIHKQTFTLILIVLDIATHSHTLYVESAKTSREETSSQLERPLRYAINNRDLEIENSNKQRLAQVGIRTSPSCKAAESITNLVGSS